VVNFDELFWIAGAIVLINRSRLELVGLGDLHEPGCQSVECAPPWWRCNLYWRMFMGDDDLAM
jgi:hypothetical protein